MRLCEAIPTTLTVPPLATCARILGKARPGPQGRGACLPPPLAPHASGLTAAGAAMARVGVWGGTQPRLWTWPGYPCWGLGGARLGPQGGGLHPQLPTLKVKDLATEELRSNFCIWPLVFSTHQTLWGKGGLLLK